MNILRDPSAAWAKWVPDAAAALVAFLAVAITILVAAARYELSPAPRGDDAHAQEVLEALVGDDLPHPVGSEANARVRAVIVVELESAGYVPSVQDTFACSDLGMCGHVKNVLARLDGTDSTGTVLVAAHYDSTPATPGAYDDGVGVAAVLELAKEMKAAPPPKNDVVFLLDDGEETGAIGAEAFAAEHPWHEHVRAFVNVDGLGGPTLVMPVGAGSASMVARLAADVREPVITSSLLSLIRELGIGYDDTRVYARAGVPTVGIGGWGAVRQYHTPLDRLSNVEPGVLGSRLRATRELVHALARAPLPDTLPGPAAVHFDLLGLMIVWWPMGWALVRALGVALLVGAVIWQLARRGALGPRRRAARASSVALLQLAAAGALATLGAAALELVFAPRVGESLRNPLDLGTGAATAWLAAFAGAALAARLFSAGAVEARLGVLAALRARRPSPTTPRPEDIREVTSPAGVSEAELDRASQFAWAWCLSWGGAAILGAAFGHLAPEASYLFVAPAILAALGGAAVAWSADSAQAPGAWARVVATLSSAALVALFAGALMATVPELVGNKGVLASALPKAAVAVALFPLLLAEPPERARRWWLALLAGTLTMLAIELFTFASSPPRPVASTLRLHDDRSSDTRRLIVFGELPPQLASGARFERMEKVFLWSSGQRPEWVATTTIAGGLAPELREVTVTLTPAGRMVQARLHSLRAAARALVAIPPGALVTSLRIEGVDAEVGTKGRRASGGWRVISVATFPPDGLALELELEGEAPVELFFSDESYVLPPSLRALAARRPPHAVPAHMGDSTTITISSKL